ncbi:transposase [Bifidobacterium eulemuris]|uniref:Transposase n=1 Tax=Bifidobacterium eulemuris TaxID=1765219 RepID=A0A261FXL6_9BIFI|nr:transposase [Bifidobacterium eulemuris]
MTYTKEHRDKAADVFIRFGLSPADTIRELGYLSRTILYTWYRERLEEEPFCSIGI